MPSQEEYLDNLLKDVMNGEQTSESGTTDGVHGNFFNGLPAEYDDPVVNNDSDGSPEVTETVLDPEISEPSSMGETAAVQESHERKERYDIQDTGDMSPEEIERILVENAENVFTEGKTDRGSMDLETLLQEAEEADLKDINEMLQKADRNEPVDEGIIELLEQAQQQNVEIEWKNIEEQRHSSKPRKERGLRKLFGKLRGRKKGGKNEGKEEQPDRHKQNESGEEKKAGEARPAKEADDVPGARKDILEGAAGSANSEMNELFDTMQALGSEQDPAVSQADKKNTGDASEGTQGGGADIMPEGAWPELQGLMLGNDLENPTESTEEKTGDRNAGPGDISEDTGAVDELISGFGIPDDADLLEKSEEHVPEDGGEAADIPDVFGFLGDMGALTEESKDTGDGEGTAKEGTAKEGEKKSKQVKKSKKEGTDQKKKGLFGRILDFLTQEDNEVEEEQQIILSDENDAILKELNEENAKKKKKKSKKKKGVNKEGGQADLEEDEEETAGKRGKSKKAKPKKKVREPKPKEPEKPGRRLSARRVALIFLTCGTIGIVLLLLCNVGIDFADKKKAASAFYEGDYETCYQNLMGKHLNESQQVMLGKSESILRMRLWMREYEMFVQAGQEPEALDSLLQSVYAYPSLYQFSAQWNALDEVQEIYGQMLEILSLKYGLTEEMAESIANERDDLVYSQLVRSIAGGGTYDGWTEDPGNRGPEGENESLEDLLPEEEELGGVKFAD